MQCKGKSVSSNEINMMPPLSYKIFPLGDSAMTIDFGNVIDEQVNDYIISLFQYLRNNSLPFQKEIVPAFSSLTVYYQLNEVMRIKSKSLTAFEWMREQLQKKLKVELQDNILDSEIIRIPVCYEKEFATDIEMISAEKKISIEGIIKLHTAVTYRVYMLGFLPGFAYMGKVDERISFARKPQPQLIKAGTVGIAGFQTGIYPLDSPGGWQIIGRTPVKMFNKESDAPTFLNTGNSVQFYSITKNEFENY